MPAAAVHEAAMWVQKKARTCAYWVLAVLIIGSIGVLVWV
jgi:hypothetical protein